MDSTIKAYSFDIYDTCIVRKWARPQDIFYLLAKEIKSKYPDLNIPEHELVRSRIESFVSVAKNSNKEEITLDYFYNNWEDLEKWSISACELLARELALEYQSILPILETKQIIQYLRREGAKIFFTSDMYLPNTFLKKILIEHNIATNEDTFYISGDIGLTKVSGNLFKYILEKESLKPSELQHYGDNIHSDIVASRRLGIKAIHYRDSQLNRYEKHILYSSQAEILVRSQISGISRAIRSKFAATDTKSKDLATIAANIVAPLLASYVAWVLQDAYKQGIKRLYFVARDGQVLLKIAQQLSAHFPTPECRYLYGSRQAWFLPSIFEVNRESLDWLIRKGESNAPKHLLKKLDIEPLEVQHILELYGFTKATLNNQLNKKYIENFWQAIEHPFISQLILEKAQQKRQLVIKYFEQEKLLSKDKWAIVDLGWALQCQRSLKKIILSCDRQIEAEGYYLGILRNCVSADMTGKYHAFIWQDLMIDRYLMDAEAIFSNVNIIDQIFTTADHSTTIGYQDCNALMIPIFKQVSVEPNKLEFTKQMHEIIVAYAEELAKSGLIFGQLETLKNCAMDNAKSFFANPQKRDVRSISQMLTSNDQNDLQVAPVARSIGISDIIYFIYQSIVSRKMKKKFTWLEGSIAISNPMVRILFLIYKFFKQYLLIEKPTWAYSLWLNIKHFTK
jgi:predicted HAD superfamily hydrolase